jgi:putative ABC transport system permease protein
MGLPLRYNVRNLFRRKLRSALTVLGVALVIATAVIMLAYRKGLLHSLRNNGDPENVMVLSRRATDRAFSSLKKGEFGRLRGDLDEAVVASFTPAPTPEDPDPLPVELAAPFVHHASTVRIQGAAGGRYGERKQAIIVGVDPEVAPHLIREFTIASGRPLVVEDEKVAVVGALTYARLGVKPEELAVGRVIEFNGVAWPIVGVFSAAGTSSDGEVWVPMDELMTVLDRPDYSYAVIKARDVNAAGSVLQMINRSDKYELRAVDEVAYYRGFAESFHTFAAIGGAMALIITLGGILVGMNTMYTAVAGRVREIGMLQVIGFSKQAVVWSFLLESLFIAVLGGLLGCGLGSLVNGMPMKVTMGVFLFRVDLGVVGVGRGLALVIGVVGALVPALRAVQLRMVEAMRYI